MNNREGMATLETTLHQKIRAASESAQTPLSPDDVANIVREVVSTLSGDITVSDLKFYAELEEGLGGHEKEALIIFFGLPFHERLR